MLSQRKSYIKMPATGDNGIEINFNLTGTTE